MKKRKRVRMLTPEERIQLRIDRLRKLVVGRRSPTRLLQRQKGGDTVLARMWNEFRSMEISIWPETVSHKECVEHEILSVLSRLGPHSSDSLERLRDAAIAQARGVLFDLLVSDFLLIKGWGGMLTMEHAYLALKLLREPNCIQDDKFDAFILVEGISRFRGKFLRTLGSIQHNLDRRRKPMYDECLYLLAANWTNPHCPLWLMSRSAIYAACPGLSNGLVVTPAMIEERLKKHALKRSPVTPIVGLELSKNNDIERFVVSKKFFELVETRVFTKSNGRQYSLVERPARYRSYCRTRK